MQLNLFLVRKVNDVLSFFLSYLPFFLTLGILYSIARLLALSYNQFGELLKNDLLKGEEKRGEGARRSHDTIVSS